MSKKRSNENPQRARPGEEEPRPAQTNSDSLRANPICPLPRLVSSPDQFEEDAREALLPRQKPFVPQLEKRQIPSKTLAAFQLGCHGATIWGRMDLLWENLPDRFQATGWRYDYLNNVADATSCLRFACLALDDAISKKFLDPLRTAINWFDETAQKWIERTEAGTLDPAMYLRGKTPWEMRSQELRTLCEGAISIENLLRPLLDLGVAFGELDLLRSHYYSALLMYGLGQPEKNRIQGHPELTPGLRPSGKSSKDMFLDDVDDAAQLSIPEIGGIAYRASVLSPSLLKRSKLLSSLSRIWHKYEDVSPLKSLQRYIDENRKSLNLTETTRLEAQRIRDHVAKVWPNLEILDHESLLNCLNTDINEMTISFISPSQSAWVEKELAAITDTEHEDPKALSALPDAQSMVQINRPISWDADKGEIRVNGKVFPVGRQARNLRSILDEFQEKKWLRDGVANPLKNINNSNPNSLSQAVKDLNDKCKGQIRFWEKLGRVYCCTLPETTGVFEKR